MIGAIMGDMIGAPYEFDRSPKTKEFPLFSQESGFTDDSVMTIAVAEALMDTMGKSDDEIKAALVTAMQKWGRRYPNAGYGGMFRRWLRAKHPEPYDSFGNGSAMRVSAAGWFSDTVEETRHMAKLTAEVTHNHPEGIKGAEATASAIFMARTGRCKEEIRDYIVREFGYDLSRTCDEIRPGYRHVESCQETVPEAITAFLEGNDFEDVIRTAVSLGGDSDTLTCIAGSVAEAFYGVTETFVKNCRERLPTDMLEVLDRFTGMKDTKYPQIRELFFNDNERIEEAIHAHFEDASTEKGLAVLYSIRRRMHADGHFIIPVTAPEDDRSFNFCTVSSSDGEEWLVAFTSLAEHRKGAPSQVITNYIDTLLKIFLNKKTAGLILNPWGEAFFLTKEMMEIILETEDGEEYFVPDDRISMELLEGGTFLKRAISIFNRNSTRRNMFRLLKILRDSWIWIPCNTILSDSDYAAVEKMLEDARENGGLDTLVGQTIRYQDDVRMVPDILQRGDDFYFPVFTSAEEMGEYGEAFSKLEKHFLEAVCLARHNEKNVKGIVINAFSESIVIPLELFDTIEQLPSSLETMEDKKEE